MPYLRDEVVDGTEPTYCTVSDVYHQMQKAEPDSAGEGGDLGREDVEEIIIDIEGVIDRFTGQAWRERRIVNDRPEVIRQRNIERYTVFGLSKLGVKTPLDAAEGDELDVWNGSQFADYVATKSQGRQDTWYVNGERGRLHVRELFSAARWRGIRERDDLVRVTYRYGHTKVPRDIKRATYLLVAASVSTGEYQVPQGFGGDVDRIRLESKEARWVHRASRLLQSHAGGGL